MLSGLALLARLVAAQYRMSPGQAQDLATAIAATVGHLANVLYPPEGVE